MDGGDRMSKLYSDQRWWDNPMPIDSLCNTCIYQKGIECDKYPKGIPDVILNKSFPVPGKAVDKTYCEYRKEN